MIVDDTMATLFEEDASDAWIIDSNNNNSDNNDNICDDDVSTLDYESFLQTDGGEYEDLEDLDDDELFESSQLHRLIHTQPIHLLKQNQLFEYHPDSFSIEPQEIFTTTIGAATSFTDPQSASTSRSSSLFSTIFPPEEDNRMCSSSYDFFECIEEGQNDFNEPLIDHKRESFTMSSSEENKFQLQLKALIPRTLPQKNLDLKLCLGLESLPKQSTMIGNETNYHYTIQTSTTTQQNSKQPADKETLLVQTLNYKLSRYAGYYTADSRDQEYSDKVRFQEISYKFSKTYF